MQARMGRGSPWAQRDKQDVVELFIFQMQKNIQSAVANNAIEQKNLKYSIWVCMASRTYNQWLRIVVYCTHHTRIRAYHHTGEQ